MSTRWHVLVVDDERVNRKLIREILDQRATCVEASCGDQALEHFTASMAAGGQPFDVILLDIAMPGTDGIEVLRAIRQREEAAGIRLGTGIPVIMITAYVQPFMTAFHEGADDYLVKPIDPDTLIAKIESKVKPRS